MSVYILMIISLEQKLKSLNDYTININLHGVQVTQTSHSKLDFATLCVFTALHEKFDLHQIYSVQIWFEKVQT